RTGPERDVDIRIELEDALALRLGVAAADGDHTAGVAALPGCGLAEVGGELGVGLLADRAGVEDDDVGILGARRLAEPELLEHALDPLRVVSVHLAAERGDVVSPVHRKRVPLYHDDSRGLRRLRSRTGVIGASGDRSRRGPSGQLGGLRHLELAWE